MPTQVLIELPEGAIWALRKTPEEFVKAMRPAAAVKLYEIGLISQGKAAELAGVNRAKFISSLSRFRAFPFQETTEHLEHKADFTGEVLT